ncbi:hypothetical protein SAMN05216266_1283 [Amycolatopsis marina]|uniref:Uncharacterized protein n=1 Tax=Amycolatopsis marina TaxID=490629 RepID=A0A1I1CG40_9PSEU|nr:hypothetical protein [Amycolatopsis marina]SFB61437.1 hypothetical protein SAMN05216266_1283 [Amycolatopsis marina]
MEKLSRVALGVLSVIAVLGGITLAVRMILYLGPVGYVPELAEIGGWGIIAGPLALGVYAAGAVEARLASRIGVGVGLMFAAFFATVLISYVVSLTAHRGGPRGNVEDGTAGILWLLAGAFFLWRLAVRRWPVQLPG